MDPYQTYADELIARAQQAALEFHRFGQEEVDRITEAAFRAAFEARLAEHEESAGKPAEVLLREALGLLR